MCSPRFCALLTAATLIASLPAVHADQPANDQPTTTTTDQIEVTATRVPEDVASVPAAVSVVSGDELRARGATDLQSALSILAGVGIAPGGDSGPASSVPELWGLREFDAFLLVVDGVPWGGAFNPALASLDLNGVDRIEVLKGAAPVMFGATSFVGVIQVIHRQAGIGTPSVSLWGGNHESGGVSASVPLPAIGKLQQTVIADGEKQGFADDRTEFKRGHVLYRAAMPLANGKLRFDVDLQRLRQSPASPRPRTGLVFSPLVPVDANHNPADAHLDEDRAHFVAGYSHSLSHGTWETTLSYTHSDLKKLRGFLMDVSNSANPNAAGYDQDVTLQDVYFDTHAALQLTPELHLVFGVDHLYGKGDQESENFLYYVPLTGGAPDLESGDPQEATDLHDERNFSGLYAHAEWTPAARWRIDAGYRLNHTKESVEGGARPLDQEEGDSGGDAEEEGGEASRTVTRGSGTFGVSYLLWQQGASQLHLFADYRNAFKPAAIDFGPEAETDILAPETSQSYELGIKGTLVPQRWRFQIAAFRMNMENLVVSQSENGFPALVNAGKQRLTGVEVESALGIAENLTWNLGYAYHDAIFQDYETLFDGVPFQLSGNHLELSAHHTARSGLVWAPPNGVNAHAEVDYVGNRYLDKRNRVESPSYTTWAAGLGYRFGRQEIRLDGENLSDERPPVAESELGDAQYYLLTARSVRLTWQIHF